MSRWWELELEVPGDLAEEVAANLVAQGASGVELIDPAEGAPPPSPGATQRPTPAPGHALLVASYAETTTAEWINDSAREVLGLFVADGERTALRIERRVDEAWKERWKAYFTPLAIGERLWVIPRWEAEAGFAPPPGALPLLIDPGLAFGTGQHATTALCLRLLERHLTPQPPPTLLDVGTGSGILAIAAVKLGTPRVVAVDNDPEAIRCAADSLALNGVGQAIELSTTPADQLPGQFPWVVANILANVLCELAPALVARTAPAGHLLLSGLLATQEQEVTAALEAAEADAFELVERSAEEEWLALLWRRRGAPSGQS